MYSDPEKQQSEQTHCWRAQSGKKKNKDKVVMQCRKTNRLQAFSWLLIRKNTHVGRVPKQGGIHQVRDELQASQL